MESQITTGRAIVIAIIVTSLMLSMFSIIFYNVTRGPGRMPQQVIRFLLTIALCVFLYRGANWARWVAIFLFGIAGVGGVILGIGLLLTNTAAVFLIAMGMFYLSCATALLVIPSVRVHFGVGKTQSSQ